MRPSQKGKGSVLGFGNFPSSPPHRTLPDMSISRTDPFTTSQHPRVDEARNDSLYELEIAFNELDRQLGRGRTGHGPVPPGDPPGGVAFKPHGKTSSTP